MRRDQAGPTPWTQCVRRSLGLISFNRKKLLSTICLKDFARFLQVRLRNLNLDPTDRLRKDPVEPHKMFVQNNSLNTLCL